MYIESSAEPHSLIRGTYRAAQPTTSEQTRLGLRDFDGEKQVGQNWCWAAVAASLAYRLPEKTKDWRQCEIIDKSFGSPPLASVCRWYPGRSSRCQDCYDNGLDRPGRIDAGMQLASVLGAPGIEIGKGAKDDKGKRITVDGLKVTDTYDLQELRRLLRANRVTALRVDIAGDGPGNIDHAIVVVACTMEDDTVWVYNPKSPKPGGTSMSFNGLQETYGKVNWKYISVPLV